MISPSLSPSVPIRLVHCAILALACAGGCAPAADQPRTGTSPNVTATPSPMVAILAELAVRSKTENPFAETHTLRTLRSQLEALPEHATPLEIWQLNSEVGRREMQQAELTSAVERYTKAYEQLPELRPVISSEKYVGTILDLAVACLRLGESQNCVAHHTSESCLFPIQGRGVHGVPDGARRATRYFIEALEYMPSTVSLDRMRAIWLLNIAFQALGESPDGVPVPYRLKRDPLTPEFPFARFVDIAPKIGLDTVNGAGGIIADDFDGDGLLDIVTSTLDVDGQLLYFHNDGDGKFSDRTDAAGLTGYTGGLNCVQTDYDNDGNRDFLVLRGAWFHHAGRHPNSLFHNNGDGTFTDVTLRSGLGFVFMPTQAGSWADYDKDGDLDLFVGNESVPLEENYPSELFRNNGDGTFTDVAAAAGVRSLNYTKATSFGDYDDDGYPDLYLSNQPFPNVLYHNDGDGTFTDVTARLDVADPVESFPIWWWDYNNDGALDLLVAGYKASIADTAAHYLNLPQRGARIHLYRNDGAGGFADVAPDVGLVVSSCAMSGNFGDLDNDGWLDFYLGTGYPGVDALMPNLMFHNRAGQGFEDVTIAGGFGHLQKGHGIAFADLDNDGDEDVFAQMGGFYPVDRFANAVFQNPGNGRPWVTIELTGTASNRAAIGVRLRLDIIDGGERRSIYRWVSSGGSFGANPLRQHVGLGAAEVVERLEIHWPTSGLVTTLTNIAARQSIAITEGVDGYRTVVLPRVSFD